VPTAHGQGLPRGADELVAGTMGADDFHRNGGLRERLAGAVAIGDPLPTGGDDRGRVETGKRPRRFGGTLKRVDDRNASQEFRLDGVDDDDVGQGDQFAG
jgi:hypothetical protein